MVNTSSVYRITVPGTATVDGDSERFALGRVVDGNRYDMAALSKAGIKYELQFPSQQPTPPPARARTVTRPRAPDPTPE